MALIDERRIFDSQEACNNLPVALVFSNPGANKSAHVRQLRERKELVSHPKGAVSRPGAVGSEIQIDGKSVTSTVWPSVDLCHPIRPQCKK